MSLARYKTLAFGISAARRRRCRRLFAIASAFVNPDTFPIAPLDLLLVGSSSEASEAFRGSLRCDLRRSSAALGPGLRTWLASPNRIIEETQKPGGPAIVYGVVLILLMFVLPNGVGGLFRRIGQLISSRRYSRSE